MLHNIVTADTPNTRLYPFIQLYFTIV